jgi:2-phospho-L-lactate/phosphoenolpyruvate guanylyltransferase
MAAEPTKPASHRRPVGANSPSSAAEGPPRWSVVVPVKVLALAKSRLAVLAGPLRPALALAMAADTVAAALACPEVATVIAVTDDPQAGHELAGLGAVVIPDEPGEGLNPALRHGAALATSRWPASPVAALAADLPALRPAELGAGLRAAAGWDHAFVPDAAGTGTTLYTARAGAAFSPRFGPGSARRHLAAGAVQLTLPGLTSLRRDVDAPPDLREAAGLGVGPRTAAVAVRLG